MATKMSIVKTITCCMVTLTILGCHANTSPWHHEPCPEACHCSMQPYAHIDSEKVKTVDCQRSQLRSIPLDVPRNAEVLILKYNNISLQDGTIPQLNELKVLDLSHNNVTEIHLTAAIFRNLSQLTYFNLQNNGMVRLLHGSFSGLKQLDVLHLANNELKDDNIEVHALGGLNHLKLLDLSGNQISAINKQWFLGMNYLEELDLSDNLIVDIKNNVFHSLHRLSKLSLRGNQLSYLTPSGFFDLESLRIFDLSNNKFTEVPSLVGSALTNLKILTLDQNPIEKLKQNDFNNLKITELNLNRMPVLKLLDSGSINNLPTLRIIQLHDNPKLTYISPESLNNVPKLSMLYLHSNNLAAIPYGLVENSPKLQNISMYNNPVQCDCNVLWVKQILESKHVTNKTKEETNATKIRDITFVDQGNIACKMPYKAQGKLLMDLDIAEIPQECAPTILTYFNEKTHYELGESVSLDCRTIGLPAPSISWYLPNRTTMNASVSHTSSGRYHVDSIGTLTIKHLHPKDSGTFLCISENAHSMDTSSTSLDVREPNLFLHPQAIKDTYITLAWNTSSIMQTIPLYHIIYYIDGKAGRKSIHWGPSYHEHIYSVTDLIPGTTYHFCIVYSVTQEVIPIKCTEVTTLPHVVADLHKGTISPAALAIILTISLILVPVVAFLLFRRYRRRLYKMPGEQDRVNIMSQIPMENMYSPPTPTQISRLTTTATPSCSAVV